MRIQDVIDERAAEGRKLMGPGDPSERLRAVLVQLLAAAHCSGGKLDFDDALSDAYDAHAHSVQMARVEIKAEGGGR